MKQHLKVSVPVTIVVYFIFSYAQWEFYNPLDIVSHLKSLTPSLRMTYLISYIAYHLCIFVGIKIYKEENK